MRWKLFGPWAVSWYASPESDVTLVLATCVPTHQQHTTSASASDVYGASDPPFGAYVF